MTRLSKHAIEILTKWQKDYEQYPKIFPNAMTDNDKKRIGIIKQVLNGNEYAAKRLHDMLCQEWIDAIGEVPARHSALIGSETNELESASMAFKRETHHLIYLLRDSCAV